MCAITGMPACTMASIWRDVAHAAFELDRLRAGADQRACGRERLLRRVVGVDGQIGYKQRAFHRPSDSPRVMQHRFQRDLGRVLVTEHDHP